MPFAPGVTIVRRDVHRPGWIAAVETARVVSDDSRGLVTWTAAGSTVMHRTTLDGVSIRKMPLRERAGAYPFDGTFVDFRPDPRWEPARLTPGWDRPPGRRNPVEPGATMTG